MIRLPIVQSFEEMDISVKKLEIHRKGKDGLVCKDNIRADISVAFYIRVEATEESVKKVSQTLGPSSASSAWPTSCAPRGPKHRGSRSKRRARTAGRRSRTWW